MSIAAIQRISLVDWPPYVVCTIFYSGCNFRCGNCHNPDLIGQNPPRMCVDEVIDYIGEARGKKIDGVVLTGGEPTIQGDLEDLIERIRSLDLLVKLDTNGANPDVLKKVDVDYVAMDLKTAPSRYSELTTIEDVAEKIRESVHILKNSSSFDYEFRTTAVPGLVRIEDIPAMGELLQNAKRWYFQDYNNDSALDEGFRAIKPYSQKELSDLLALAQRWVPHARIRGLDWES
jgi:pyruvate formate lyase activating enzyme